MRSFDINSKSNVSELYLLHYNLVVLKYLLKVVSYSHYLHKPFLIIMTIGLFIINMHLEHCISTISSPTN